MHEAVKLIENSLDATFTRLAQNISILQDKLEKTPQMYAYPNPYSNQYGDYGYATGVLCYWAVIIVIAAVVLLCSLTGNYAARATPVCQSSIPQRVK